MSVSCGLCMVYHLNFQIACGTIPVFRLPGVSIDTAITQLVVVDVEL